MNWQTFKNQQGKTPNTIDKVLLPYTSWALLLLIPIAFMGFYPSYYSTLRAPVVIHIHSALMTLWLLMVVIQTWLIKKNNYKWHRFTGKLSYILVPCIFFVGYFVLRNGFLRVLGGDIVAPPEYYPEGESQLTKAADFTVIGSVYFIWLFLYYMLGISYRKKTYAHATFMLAASLTILGPAGDRLLWHIYNVLGWKFNVFAENFTFGVIFIVFSGLFVFHRIRNLPLWPTITVITIHILGIFLFYTMPFHPLWDSLAAFLFSNT